MQQKAKDLGLLNERGVADYFFLKNSLKEKEKEKS